MKIKLLENVNSTDLILFLTGWGCDDNQFKNISSTSNVLLCWNYADLTLDFDFSKYSNINLLCYSAGVFIASLLQNKLPKFNKTVAVNGNPLMLDKKFGIDKSITDQMLHLNKDNCLEFIQKYLVFDDTDFRRFISTPSLIPFDTSRFELIKLEEYYKQNFMPMNFDCAVLSDNDKIFNPKTQQEYFKDKFVLLRNSAHHSPFLKYKLFDDFFKL